MVGLYVRRHIGPLPSQEVNIMDRRLIISLIGIFSILTGYININYDLIVVCHLPVRMEELRPLFVIASISLGYLLMYLCIINHSLIQPKSQCICTDCNSIFPDVKHLHIYCSNCKRTIETTTTIKALYFTFLHSPLEQQRKNKFENEVSSSIIFQFAKHYSQLYIRIAYPFLMLLLGIFLLIRAYIHVKTTSLYANASEIPLLTSNHIVIVLLTLFGSFLIFHVILKVYSCFCLFHCSQCKTIYSRKNNIKLCCPRCNGEVEPLHDYYKRHPERDISFRSKEEGDEGPNESRREV